jgi:hypothetical protein
MIVASQTYIEHLSREIIYPKWKLLSFNPSTDTWAEIISGTYGQTPVELTEFVQKMEHSFDRLAVTMVDSSSLVFHPDGGALRAALAQGRIIRLYEGFEGLAESEWLVTFTGTVEGSYSWTYQRGELVQVSFTAFSRANNQAWKRRNVTSNSFTIGSDWGSMFSDIAKNVMLLEDAEVVVPEPWGVLFDKNSNQVVNYPPWDAMEQLTFGINAVPFFNGNGQLDLYYITQNRVTHTLEDDKLLRKYEAKGSSAETINKVILTYLSNTLSRVDGPDQILASATCTVGFFKREFDIPCFYSDERKTRSDNPRFVIKASANSGLIKFCEEEMTQIDEFSSNIHVEVSIFALLLATNLLIQYLAASAIPDGVTAFGGGVTIPIGSIIAAIALVGILFIMMCLGTGQYEIWGTPYEMVYLEQQAIALKSGTEFWQEREKEIRNDFISTVEQAQPLVINQLHYEVMKENPRTLLLRYDPRIEPGDVIEVSSGVKVWVENVSRPIGRAFGDTHVMTVSGYRTVI